MVNLGLCKIIQLGLLRRNNSVICTAFRNAGAWNKDWKPGPYPKTQEEREAAAKKYGLHPKDYEPYPDDGTGFGDYPMFKPVSVESKDPFEHYDLPEFRRNFGEVLHADADLYVGERVDVNKHYPVKPLNQLLIYIAVMSVSIYLFYNNYKNGRKMPRMPQQYPGDGKKHYTFEPAS